MEYEKYIKRCLELAQRGEYFVAPNPMVGAVLVRNSGETILAEGWHERYGEGHAEVNCFKHLESSDYKDVDLSGCTLFVSLEPCCHYGKTPPCAKLIIEKGVGCVVIGMLDPNPIVAGKGVEMLQNAGIRVVSGICEQECQALNKRFLCLHEEHRPYVVLKWAQTADGFVDYNRSFTAYQSPITDTHLNGALAISTPETKKLVHKMRAENMAIMVGTNTVLLDNPQLRTTHWEGRNPIRVTIDRHGILPVKSRIFASTESDYKGIEPVIVYRERTDWESILGDLAQKGIHSLLVEGGPKLLTYILDTGLWDEIHIEVAPELVIGNGLAAPPIELPENHETVDGHKLYVITR